MQKYFHLLGIDPGKTTGLALLKGKITTGDIIIREVNTFYTLAPTAFLIDLKALAQVVVMEQKPSHPSKDGETSWDLLYHGLINLGYAPKHNIPTDLPNTGLFFIAPGQWKPFMKSRAKALPRIDGTNRHSRDAWKMAHYLIQRIYPTKELHYE